jgi:YesN/AraC family two-component response regulator
MAVTLKTFAGQMLSAFNSRNDLYLEIAGAYLKLFLIECNGHCTLLPDENTQSYEVGKTLVKNFKTLVETHFSEWHQVKDYAEALYVTPNYLNEAIKSAMNISAKDVIQHTIILEAKRQAVFTGKSNKEIGFSLGFEDPSHFSKFFKNNTGQSLQEFRESITL